MRRLRSAWFWLVGHAGVNRLSRALHPILYRWTGGWRFLGRSLGNLTVLVTTLGRHTGRPRTVALWAYPDGDALVLVGSYGGLGIHTFGNIFRARISPAERVLLREVLSPPLERLFWGMHPVAQRHHMDV